MLLKLKTNSGINTKKKFGRSRFTKICKSLSFENTKENLWLTLAIFIWNVETPEKKKKAHSSKTKMKLKTSHKNKKKKKNGGLCNKIVFLGCYALEDLKNAALAQLTLSHLCDFFRTPYPKE